MLSDWIDNHAVTYFILSIDVIHICVYIKIKVSLHQSSQLAPFAWQREHMTKPTKWLRGAKRKTCFLFTLTLLHSVPCCSCHSKYLPAAVTAKQDVLRTYCSRLMSYALPINYTVQF